MACCTSGFRRLARPAGAGFTLVELLAVIGIIALLLALLLPALSGVRTSAKRASTESLMREVLNGATSFQAANSRLPGFFSATDVGSSVNRDQRGFTAMENLLLDLAGGIVPADDPRYNQNPADDNTLIVVGPFTSRDQNVLVDTADIGAADGPGFLSLKAQDLYAVRGQAIGALEEPDYYENGILTKGMPDVVDAFGQPILAWVQDPAARVNPPTDIPADPYEYFVREEYVAAENERAPFYWASNAGYLNAGGTSPQPDEPWTEGLGEDRINQRDFSAIGGDTSLTTERRMASMAGILGSPAFPVERQGANDPWRPAQARGSIILTSAGPDQIYFAPQTGRQEAVSGLDDRAVLGYAPTGQQGYFNNQTTRTVDQTDDIVQSSGG